MLGFAAMSKPSCGPHTDLATNENVRITRCGCGTLHVTLVANGVTLRLTHEQAKKVVSGLNAAMDRLEDHTSVPSSCVN